MNEQSPKQKYIFYILGAVLLFIPIFGVPIYLYNEYFPEPSPENTPVYTIEEKVVPLSSFNNPESDKSTDEPELASNDQETTDSEPQVENSTETETENLEQPPAPTPNQEPTTAPASEPLISTKTYTNIYLPNLKIEYPSDWTFRTDTEKSIYDGLVEREIILQKGRTKIRFYSTPAFPTGCGGPAEPYALFRENILGSGINRYNFSEGDIYSKSQPYDECILPAIFEIQSNISVNDVPDYKEIFSGSENSYVNYWMWITVEDAQYLNEADAIVANSVLR